MNPDELEIEGAARAGSTERNDDHRAQRQSVPVVDRRSQKPSRISGDIAETKRQIAATRSKNAPGFVKNATVVELVTTALRKRGEFYHDTLRGYLFLKGDRVLLPLERDELGLELLLHGYGLFPSEG